MRILRLVVVGVVVVLLGVWVWGEKVDRKEDRMEKFEFLLGNWHLESKVPKSAFSEGGTGSGSGTFKRALGDRFVFFDYRATSTGGSAEAHGVFAWDDRVKVYRYWWFEDSGACQTATCNFVDKDTLCMNWHDTLLRQTFKKEGPNKVVLKMYHPLDAEKYELILEVILTRK